MGGFEWSQLFLIHSTNPDSLQINGKQRSYCANFQALSCRDPFHSGLAHLRLQCELGFFLKLSTEPFWHRARLSSFRPRSYYQTGT
jgi:hypothetical protein